jgi:formylglycine-generating enzyme required for sulfatase activity
MTLTKTTPPADTRTETRTRRLERLPFWPMLGLGTLTGLGLGWWLLFQLSAGSASFPVGGVLVVLLSGWLLAARLRAVARKADAQAETPQPPPAGTGPEPAPPSAAPLLGMLPVAAGEFLMGSAAKESDSYPNERPQHQIRLTPFLLARSPVTRGQYRELIKKRIPDDWQEKGGDDLPATYISWKDAVNFCNALSQREGLPPAYDDQRKPVPAGDGYRLPTEAEWEYACRAGTKTPWFWGTDGKEADKHAWYSDNSGK